MQNVTTTKKQVKMYTELKRFKLIAKDEFYLT